MREKKKPKKRILCAIISCSLLASIGFAQPASAADTAVDTPAVQDDIETMSYSDGTSTGTSELTGVTGNRNNRIRETIHQPSGRLQLGTE